MMLTTSNDKEIIEFIKDNQEYFFRVAFSYVKNQDQALDIVQEAIVKALQKRYTLRHIEYLKTWFYRILINESIKSSRKNKKLEEYELLDNVATDKKYDEELIESIDIYKNIQKLNEKLKTVIILRFFENLKIEEIAYITKTNVSTVKSRLYKGMEELKKSLERSDCI